MGFLGRNRKEHAAAVRAAHDATMRHSTARAKVHWSIGKAPPSRPELPREMTGEAVLDLAHDRVAFDESAGGDIIDGGRVYTPAPGDGDGYTVRGNPDDPLQLGMPPWLLSLPYGLVRARARQEELIDGELWQRYECQCDIRAAVASRMRALEEPALPIHVLPVAVWVDADGRSRQVSAKWGPPYSAVRLRDFDGPGPVQIPASVRIVEA